MIKTSEHFDIKFLDASRISKFSRCEARFLLGSLMGLRSSDESKINLDYGTVMHAVLPHMYSGDPTKAFEVFDDLWAKFPYGEEDDKMTTELSRTRINNFVASHAPGSCSYEIMHFPFSNPAKDLISENEVPFLIDVGLKYPLTGRIDAPIKWLASKATWAYDFKTSSELSDRLFDGFWMSPQACVYTIALSQITGEKIDGFIVEGMRKSKTKFESQLGFTFVHVHHLKRFLDELKDLIKRLDQANESGIWHQNYALCSSYSSFGFPCKACEYKMICDCPNWEDGARFYKREKPFDPLEVKI